MSSFLGFVVLTWLSHHYRILSLNVADLAVNGTIVVSAARSSTGFAIVKSTAMTQIGIRARGGGAF
jgi:hypothetical protein